MFCGVLLPIFWQMWIYHGTGNANFYYAVNLVLALGQIMLITDTLGAVLKDEYLEKKRRKEVQEARQEGEQERKERETLSE